MKEEKQRLKTTLRSLNTCRYFDLTHESMCFLAMPERNILLLVNASFKKINNEKSPTNFRKPIFWLAYSSFNFLFLESISFVFLFKTTRLPNLIFTRVLLLNLLSVDQRGALLIFHVNQKVLPTRKPVFSKP